MCEGDYDMTGGRLAKLWKGPSLHCHVDVRMCALCCIAALSQSSIFRNTLDFLGWLSTYNCISPDSFLLIC